MSTSQERNTKKKTVPTKAYLRYRHLLTGGTAKTYYSGLLQDSNGIPITYQKFSGNTSDNQTLIPALSNFKKDYKSNHVVVVADKGLNCSSNIAATVANKDGFVFSQSVRGTKSDSELKDWVLSSEGYKVKKNDSFKIKSMLGHKTVHIKAEDSADKKSHDIDIEVKYVAFWSEKYQRRARQDRQKAIDKAHKLIANPAAYTKATSYGAIQYIKDIKFDKDTGAIANTHSLEINWEAIEEAQKYDGYYLIVTSETEWSDKKIVDAYKELWRIEESFKITKSELNCRPVYVWTPKHIEAHFLICFIALTILRLLQLQSGLCCSKIKEEIDHLKCVNVDANWWVCPHRTDESDKLLKTVGLEQLELKNLTTKDAKNILANARKAKIPYIK